MKRSLITGLAAVCLAIATPARADVVTTWNATTVNCVAIGRPGPTGTIDIALVQGAVHDAVQTVEGRFQHYRYSNPSRRGLGTSDAAAASAAYQTLIGLYGTSQTCLNGIQLPSVVYPGNPGLQTGIEAAASFLQIKRPPFTLPTDPFTGGTQPGEWRLTPGVTAAQNTYMAVTEPFTLLHPRQFRPEPPPPLKSEHYRRDYDEVKALGRATNSTRTDEQTDLSRFWNSIPSQLFGGVRTAADQYLSNIGDRARLLALVSYAAADSQITVYESKYHYNFWRPYTAIREGDNDTNDHTIGDANWTPFVATPAYPDYSSGANCITAAVTTVMQLFFGSDDVDFTVSSTVANLLQNPRVYHQLSDVQADMVEVRIYQGIHFRFADEQGRQQGARVGHWVFQKFLKPATGKN
jgi:hypothetical protein